MLVSCLRHRSIYLSLVIAMDACYSTLGCVLWLRCGPLMVVCCSSPPMDRAFKPVGKHCVRPSWSWVYPTMVVVPSITRFPVFSCLCGAMIEISYLCPLDAVTVDLMSLPTLSSPTPFESYVT
jgi:hypothetical protein